MDRSLMVRGVHDAMCKAVEASSNGELVETALPELLRSFGASYGLMYRVREDGMESWVPSSLPDDMSVYRQHVADCPFQVIKRRHNPRVAIISDMLDSTTERKSEVLNEFFYPRDFHRQLIARIGPFAYGE